MNIFNIQTNLAKKTSFNRVPKSILLKSSFIDVRVLQQHGVKFTNTQMIG